MNTDYFQKYIRVPLNITVNNGGSSNLYCVMISSIHRHTLIGRFVPYHIANEEEARSTIRNFGLHGAFLTEFIVNSKKVPEAKARKAKPAKPKQVAAQSIDSKALLDLLENLKRITAECEQTIKCSVPDLFPVGVIDENLVGKNALVWLKDVHNPYKVRVEKVYERYIDGSYIYLGENISKEQTGVFLRSRITRIFVLK